MTGPQDPAAAGRDRLRAGHADRDEVIEILKDAFVDGCLTMGEFGARTDRALAARTCADLDALIADLPPAPVWPAPAWPVPVWPAPAWPAPAWPAPAWPAPAPAGRVRPPGAARRWPLVRAAADSSLCLVLAFTAILTGVHFDTDGFGPHQAWANLFFFPAIALVITAFGILANGAATAVEQRRARRALPQPRLPPAARFPLRG